MLFSCVFFHSHRIIVDIFFSRWKKDSRKASGLNTSERSKGFPFQYLDAVTPLTFHIAYIHQSVNENAKGEMAWARGNAECHLRGEGGRGDDVIMVQSRMTSKGGGGWGRMACAWDKAKLSRITFEGGSGMACAWDKAKLSRITF